MEKKFNSYETLFVVDTTLSEEEIKATVEKFTTLIADNGTIEEVNEWGKRRLAYPIDYITEGYYVLVNFKSEPDFPRELSRVFGITEGIIRYMTTAKEVKADSVVAEEVSVEEVAEAAEATEE